MASESKGDIRILEQALREATDHGRGAVKVYRAEATLALAELSAAREMREVLKECRAWIGDEYDARHITAKLIRLIGGGG